MFKNQRIMPTLDIIFVSVFGIVMLATIVNAIININSK